MTLRLQEWNSTETMQLPQPQTPDGVLVVDKPEGMTSHDVVQRVRRLLGTSRVGHLGTLDPMATGVLPLCIGQATRIARYLPSFPKEYSGAIRFGFSTTTYDREGTPTSAVTPFTGTREEVAAAMQGLTGRIEQVPPAYSAKKLGGVPAYKLARQGRPATLHPVAVEVSAFELTAFDPPSIGFRVVCSGGTYVRSLAHDLGKRLGCNGHLVSLRRLRSGDFGIGQSVALADAGGEHVIPLERLLENWPVMVVSGEDETRVRHGNPVAAETAAGAIDGTMDRTTDGFVRIFDTAGRLVAVAAVESGWVRPRVVLTSQTSANREFPSR